jgi:Bacteriophage tail sheath protein
MSSAAPGVYKAAAVLRPPAEVETGVPAFLGVADGTEPRLLSLPADFAFATPADGLLAPCVRSFFANGGTRCYVVPLADVDPASVEAGLDRLDRLDDVDLVCVPDAVRRPATPTAAWLADVASLQRLVVERCEASETRFAILDSVPADTPAVADADTPAGPHLAVRAQRAGVAGRNGALYYPWLRRLDDPATLVPPCGEVAAVYARTDAASGVHRAPANEQLDDTVDVEIAVAPADQGLLNDLGINCIRSFPGRGVRVWGARTLAEGGDVSSRYVNVRRVVLTVARWLLGNTEDLAFEPNGPELWAAVRLRLSTYLTGLHRTGALRGATPADAFYVKCDAENNTDDVRSAGGVVVEIGVAPAVPNEFVVVHIVHQAAGAAVASAPAV